MHYVPTVVINRSETDASSVLILGFVLIAGQVTAVLVLLAPGIGSKVKLPPFLVGIIVGMLILKVVHAVHLVGCSVVRSLRIGKRYSIA